jgi:hypothetical protein
MKHCPPLPLYQSHKNISNNTQKIASQKAGFGPS